MSRDHVVGQPVPRVPEQRGVVGVLPGACHQVGDQPLIARMILADDDHGLIDRGVIGKHRLDLAELDPEAAQLDLVVPAAEALEHAVGADPADVAGRVHPLSGEERVRHEPLGGQLRAVQVAERDACAADEDLA